MEVPRTSFAQRIFGKCFCKSLKQTLNSISQHDYVCSLFSHFPLYKRSYPPTRCHPFLPFTQHSRFREWLQRFCLALQSFLCFCQTVNDYRSKCKGCLFSISLKVILPLGENVSGNYFAEIDKERKRRSDMKIDTRRVDIGNIYTKIFNLCVKILFRNVM